jgi:hypothetical protein
MLGWDKKSLKKNRAQKDFKTLGKQLHAIERLRGPQGKLSFLGVLLIKIGLLLLRMETRQNLKMIKNK